MEFFWIYNDNINKTEGCLRLKMNRCRFGKDVVGETAFFAGRHDEVMKKTSLQQERGK